MRLKRFHQKCLRRTLGIRWPMYLVDVDIHQHNQSTSIKSFGHFSTGYDGVVLWSGWWIIGSLSNFSTVNWPGEKDQRRNQNWRVMIASRTQFFQSFLAKWLGKSRSRYPWEKQCTMVRENWIKMCWAWKAQKIVHNGFDVSLFGYIGTEFDLTCHKGGRDSK